MNYRSKQFLELCRGADCYLNVPGVCNHNPETVVPCHSNESQHGKGMSIKAHDCFTVPGCSACHAWIDQGPAHRDEKRAVWRSAFFRWIPNLFINGSIVVNTRKMK